MKKFKIKLTKDFYLITYKLLHDALFLLLASFAAMLVAEGLLPGTVTAHISMAKVLILILFVIGGIIWIGDRYQIYYDAPVLRKSKSLPALILFAFLLIGNSLLRFPLWANLIITLTTLCIFFFLYKEIFCQEK